VVRLVDVQAPSFPCGYHSGVRSLVLQVWDKLRDLAEMMKERGGDVDPSTIMRWVHRYAPELEKRVRWYQGYRATSWRVDETYVKVGGN
jgi:transposase-like protein